jgi:hypothetical protein
MTRPPALAYHCSQGTERIDLGASVVFTGPHGEAYRSLRPPPACTSVSFNTLSAGPKHKLCKIWYSDIPSSWTIRDLDMSSILSILPESLNQKVRFHPGATMSSSPLPVWSQMRAVVGKASDMNMSIPTGLPATANAATRSMLFVSYDFPCVHMGIAGCVL